VVESEGDDGVEELPLETPPAHPADGLGPEGNGATHQPEGLAEDGGVIEVDDAPDNGDADGSAGADE